MKKDRNSFFEGSAMNMASYNTMPNMMPQMTSNASSNFFATSPMIPVLAPVYPNSGYNDSNLSEIESRLSKIERNIARLDNRLSKLEGSTYYSQETETTSNGMYMV